MPTGFLYQCFLKFYYNNNNPNNNSVASLLATYFSVNYGKYRKFATSPFLTVHNDFPYGGKEKALYSMDRFSILCISVN